MARETKARDHGGRPQVTEQEEQPSASGGTTGHKVVSSFVNDATNAYHEEISEEIKSLTEEWEHHFNHHGSVTDI